MGLLRATRTTLDALIPAEDAENQRLHSVRGRAPQAQENSIDFPQAPE
jgi:hypothetical protein